MNNISEVVDSLENRISKLLHRYEKLKEANQELKGKIELLNEKQSDAQSEIDQMRSTCESLKLANAMLGSDQHKRETKLKINALVREIDNCIAQLSE